MLLKVYFHTNFLLEKKLFYEGETPNIAYYNNISVELYKEFYKKDGSFYKESINYLEKDLMSLFQVLSKVNKQVFNDYDVNIKDNLTISGLAIRIFLKSFYKGNIPAITRASMYTDLKRSYYGGITEVYKPVGHNLYYYDVNSLYPYVALQDMPGLTCNKVNYYKNKSIDDLFGFFYCSIETPLDGYFGSLPVRDSSAISFPLGKWKGWYFSEELKFAQENGYRINVIRGYSFSREKGVFDNYINKIYQIKSNALNKTQRGIAKSLLNNLLGRFAIALDKDISVIVNYKTFREMLTMKKITSYKSITNDKILVNYTPRLDKDIIKSHGLDMIKILSKHKDEEIQSLNVSSIAISAAVNAYARIHISKLKLDILRNGAKIYYSDTDSIITDKVLDKNLVGTGIGKLKLEHVIDKGIFITGKVYCLWNNKGDFISRAKGVKSNSVSYFDYVKLVNDNNINTAVKSESIIDWNKGDVKITDKLVNINSSSFNKRSKIKTNGKWVDTKPLIINTIDRSLIKYKKNFNVIVYNKNTSRNVDYRSTPFSIPLQTTKNIINT